MENSLRDLEIHLKGVSEVENAGNDGKTTFEDF